MNMTKVTAINTLAVKPGQIDEFISLQREFAMSRSLPGLTGGRMYRNQEGTKVVLVSQFESAAAQAAIVGGAELQAHIGKLRKMVESSSPEIYEEAYTYGAFK
jgi:heme-degrading monooxygenase HmoA